ncbi:probable G-protein coupled receptor 33 [Xenopus laevis]|uniref:Probable G-protein coupled receptor 33 n=2 Tax=Xenopus laevis TaxID=8355 RepID=A0A1L8FNZ0_XENLA|nr:probable G-protein coupled receptor 33 [Xenopus laevis]OCT73312.1 hypothetical protein XELAEV_18036293mg [Xenopus laevis]
MNTTTGMTYTSIKAGNLLSAVALLVSLLFGLVLNTLYLWVLRFRMRKSINTTWFFHLILPNFVFTITMPFLAAYMIMLPHWIFGSFLCKCLNSLFSVCMYASVFFLTVISLDRYSLVFHPVWYRGHMNNSYASAICISLWGLAILFSSPYLVFRQTHLLEDNKTTICYNNYTISGSIWQESKIQLRWVMFSFHLLLGFLLPFAVITVCYVRIALRMKKGNLVRSSKPYKIIFITVASFFISWFPYHLWYGMRMTNEEGRFHKTTLSILMAFSTCLICINYCFTPLFYLFIAKNFKKSLRKSILLLIESVFNETLNSLNRSFEDKSYAPSSSAATERNQGEAIHVPVAFSDIK